MNREKIILSTLDLDIMNFIKTEKYILHIKKEFNIDSSQIKIHLDRLRNIKCMNEEKYGTFKKLILNSRGINILEVLK